jgi:hypothetical protein
MRRISLAALIILAACQDDGTPTSSSIIGEGGSVGTLERAAIESGAIADATRLSPIGLYQRRHEAGRDKLCIVPDGSGTFRFGVEAMFGEGLACRGAGSARRAGDKLILSFSGRGSCIIVARYDGDQLTMPGVVDTSCASICGGRGTLEGVSFPRLTSDAASALKARDATGNELCRPD